MKAWLSGMSPGGLDSGAAGVASGGVAPAWLDGAGVVVWEEPVSGLGGGAGVAIVAQPARVVAPATAASSRGARRRLNGSVVVMPPRCSAPAEWHLNDRLVVGVMVSRAKLRAGRL